MCNMTTSTIFQTLAKLIPFLFQFHMEYNIESRIPENEKIWKLLFSVLLSIVNPHVAVAGIWSHVLSRLLQATTKYYYLLELWSWVIFTHVQSRSKLFFSHDLAHNNVELLIGPKIGVEHDRLITI